MLLVVILFCVWGSGRRQRQAWGGLVLDLEGGVLVQMKVLSADPMIRRGDDFLKPGEAQALISQYRSGLKRSLTHAGPDGDVEDLARTSWSAFLPAGDNGAHKLLHAVEKRAAVLLGTPLKNFETFQMVRYEPGQQYRPHHDYLDGGKNKNNRVWTGLVYLTGVADEEQGGATRFPEIGLVIWPKEGSIVVWTNCTQQGCDSRTLHGGEPPLQSVKYILNIWSRSAKTR